jgi:hypothetical protein
MPWNTPGTAVAGDVLTAAFWNSNVRDNSLMGQPVFTNEAARDAAITSPVEGQSVYLTAPTIPAATGSTTQLPSGILTTYNGSVWVCVTPVGAREPTGGNTTSTSFTTTLNTGTNPTVTLVTGITALISIGALIYNSITSDSYLSISVSGATTLAGQDSISAYHSQTFGIVSSRTFILAGLTAGTNTFSMTYRVTSGSGTFGWRTIAVNGIA